MLKAIAQILFFGFAEDRAGVIILLGTLALFGLSSFEVSQHDILRGAALGLF